MSLGKRGRPPMKRNLSMTEFTLDLINGGEDDRVFPQLSPNFSGAFSAAASHRRSSSDFVETANFLRDCSLCKRRLISGQDIYMYRFSSCAVACLSCLGNLQQRVRENKVILLFAAQSAGSIR
ncbi:FCS-Like Zinc finger 5-like isoform X3 [Salvia splendens]|uniref:FCS-Like Zinc finger 5-like isoform X3 n=1 Tax=Salvia splendens TaxID=180675 RepID=UPI001C266ED2|nr:FCS-Like Zinc finger 5-like isoform X3 [Salvia splendens]